MAELQKELRNRFTQGYICAVANLVNMHGESTEACELLACCFTSVKELKSCGVEPRDIETLKPLIKEIIEKRKRNKLSDES